MGDSSNKQQPINDKVVEVLVDSIFRKNGIKSEELSKNISDDQKKKIKEMVEDLKLQVEEFKQNSKNVNKK